MASLRKLNRVKKVKEIRKMHDDIGKPLKEKRRLITRRKKKVTIRIITRKEQPMPVHLQTMQVTALARQDVPLQRVSSSWIRELGYHRKEKFAVMTTKQGYGYYIRCPWKVFMEWFFAHSKGTYFNRLVKGKYKITRYR